MHLNAGMFLRDAIALGENATAGQFILFTHAIELALKSFLHQDGRSLKDLRLQFGHDLNDLMKDAQKAGLHFREADAETVVAQLSQYREYVTIRHDFSAETPSVADAARVAQSIVEATKPAPHSP